MDISSGVSSAAFAGRLFASIVFSAILCAAAPASAELVTYELSGHMSVPPSYPTAEWATLNGAPFSARLSYDLSYDQYSSDWQGENPRFGEYLTLAPGTSLTLESGGLYLKSDPSFYTNLRVVNDCIGLADPPHLLSDSFAIQHYTTLTTTYPGYTGQILVEGQSVDVYEPPWTGVTPYLFTFLAKDSTQSVFSDDVLKTVVDFSRFDDIRIQIQLIVPRGVIPSYSPCRFESVKNIA